MAETVLLVDDDKDLVEVTYTMLSYVGIKVSTAFDGKDAIEVYKTQKPGLVFMDIMMPRMDGYDAFFKIKHHDPGAKVILLTGYTEDSQRLKDAKAAGLLDVVHKPLTLDDYRDLISKYG